MTEDKEFIGKMDPFIQISFGQQIFKTKERKDAGKSTSFPEVFTIQRENREETINFIIFDKDTFSSKMVGMGSIAIDRFIQNPSVEQNVIVICYSQEKMQGNIIFDAKFDNN